MTWDAETTIQLISVLVAILGIVIACYNHQSIITAIRRAYSMFPHFVHYSGKQN